MADDLAAQLAEWGEGFEEELNRAFAEEDDSLKRSLCLLAAVEAALKRHAPITRREGWNPTCSYDNHRWPCPEVADITAALTEGEARDG